MIQRLVNDLELIDLCLVHKNHYLLNYIFHYEINKWMQLQLKLIAKPNVFLVIWSKS